MTADKMGKKNLFFLHVTIENYYLFLRQKDLFSKSKMLIVDHIYLTLTAHFINLFYKSFNKSTNINSTIGLVKHIRYDIKLLLIEQ